jgi:hypothetical protein
LVPATEPQISVACVDYKQVTKNTLRGFATLRLRLGAVHLVIKDCPHHENHGREWVGFPGRAFTGGDGTQKWASLIEFGEAMDRADRDRFQAAAVAAIERYLACRAEG